MHGLERRWPAWFSSCQQRPQWREMNGGPFVSNRLPLCRPCLALLLNLYPQSAFYFYTPSRLCLKLLLHMTTWLHVTRDNRPVIDGNTHLTSAATGWLGSRPGNPRDHGKEEECLAIFWNSTWEIMVMDWLGLIKASAGTWFKGQEQDDFASGSLPASISYTLQALLRLSLLA